MIETQDVDTLWPTLPGNESCGFASERSTTVWRKPIEPQDGARR